MPMSRPFSSSFQSSAVSDDGCNESISHDDPSSFVSILSRQ
jgi:hypothetical protein